MRILKPKDHNLNNNLCEEPEDVWRIRSSGLQHYAVRQFIKVSVEILASIFKAEDYLANFSTLNTDTTRCFETSVDFYRTTGRYKTEDTTAHSHHSQDLKSNYNFYFKCLSTKHNEIFQQIK
jgi:hypothetical protein